MEGLGSLLLFAVFFYIMMRYGCGAHMMHGHGGHGGHAGHGGGEKHVDPVCGMVVESDKGYGKMYKDRLYRFCSKSCLDKFDVDPDRYLNKEKGKTHEM